MQAAHAPLLLDRQVCSELGEQMLAGHHASGKEVSPHPVRRAIGFEQIRAVAMAKDVHKRQAVVGQPARYTGQQQLVISHVLKHLHRNNAIELLARVEGAHVGRDHSDV